MRVLIVFVLLLLVVTGENNAQWVSRWTLPKSFSFASSYPFYSFYHPHGYSTDTFSRILKNSSPFNSKVHFAVLLRSPVSLTVWVSALHYFFL